MTTPIPQISQKPVDQNGFMARAWYLYLQNLGVAPTPTPQSVSVFGFFPGTASVVATGVRIYPNFAGTFTVLEAWSSVPVTSNTVVTVLLNGATSVAVTIPSGASFATATISLAVIATDYLTASLSAINASNVGFRIGNS